MSSRTCALVNVSAMHMKLIAKLCRARSSTNCATTWYDGWRRRRRSTRRTQEDWLYLQSERVEKCLD